jgi:hypothetical protein
MSERHKRERDIAFDRAKRLSKRSSNCIYCGIRPAVKNEHVVGKVFFDKLPLDVITVPSCDECDKGKGDGGLCDFHLDEEYMRNVLCLKTDVGTHRGAFNLLPKVMRSIGRSFPMAQATVATSHLVNVRTQQGIILPNQLAFNVNLTRVERVIKKIVRGLFYAKEYSRLPNDVEFGIDLDVSPAKLDEYRAMFLGDPNLWYGMGDVFMYKAARQASASFQTMWLMVFYRSHAIMACTATKEDMVKLSEVA